MKKTYQKPEVKVISLSTEEAQMSAVSSTMSVSLSTSEEDILDEDSEVGAKIRKSLWDDDEE